MIDMQGLIYKESTDPIYVNGKKVIEAYVNGKLVYPSNFSNFVYMKLTLDWDNNNDEDLHCVEPNGTHIYYANKVSSTTKGFLNVDMTNPSGFAEEIITWPRETANMILGEYYFYVYTFTYRGARTPGFWGTLEVGSRTYTFRRNNATSQGLTTPIARVNITGRGYSVNMLL